MTTTYHIGLDMHAQSTAIAWALSKGDLEFHGNCSATIQLLERTLRRLARKLDTDFRQLRICYEAGSTGQVDRSLHILGERRRNGGAG